MHKIGLIHYRFSFAERKAKLVNLSFGLRPKTGLEIKLWSKRTVRSSSGLSERLSQKVKCRSVIVYLSVVAFFTKQV